PEACPPPCQVECAPCRMARRSCAAAPPKVLVELSQPEVHYVAPRGQGNCGAGPCAGGAGRESGEHVYSKNCSFLNLSINKMRGRGPCAAGMQPVTTMVPAYATATIPIAFQTTRYTA